MRVILTHEQADFDAVASQLGAYLLDEDAYPVLPQRINRNVRAFLTIYGAELPFVERRDLPGGPIASTLLVDTQSLISLKGMEKSMSVRVVDHHNLRADLPENWQVTVQPTGATTTLLVELLQQRGVSLTTIQASLLLLGIYEDTGSLTYTRTTPRDLQAASFLLQSGASLQLVSDYLNHPLSLAQQALYDHLQAAAQTHRVHGHSILVAVGEAVDSHEELSTIAHKLRDSLDPDALVLLVRIHGGVQLIARSTNDQIDVSAIADHFGGGGHARAAAALIKGRDLAAINADLVDILPKLVTPAVTVARIMSRGPQLITPETSLEEAARRMQRYGYEGYPVVSAGRVVGLLTRRAVDRAVNHRLKVDVRAVMEAGTYSVTPNDSLEALQFVMTESGWGQVPVVDPQTGNVIGIVTRTDLLKTLAPEAPIPGRQNLTSRLEAALPPVHLVLLKAIAEAAHQQQIALYIVGGFVRDLLLEMPSLDFDLVVEGDAIALAKTLARQHGGRVTAHRRFGTAKWLLDPEWIAQLDGKKIDPGQLKDLQVIDFISARTEFYTHPTALPTVERGSIKLDLHRRDFTINTLAMRLDGPHFGEIHDYWGGLNDLRQGIIRVLHSLSFVDDPTRMLRAVRFEQRFGFEIEPRSLELIQAALELLDRVSGDRIRHELDYILDEPRRLEMLNRLSRLNLLEAIHADLPWDEHVEHALGGIQKPDPDWDLDSSVQNVPVHRALAYTIWLLRLPQQNTRWIARRLKVTRSLEKIMVSGCRLWQQRTALAQLQPSAFTYAVENMPLLALYAVFLMAEEPLFRDRLLQYVKTWRHIRPVTSGHDLRRLGLKPGPAFKQILAELRTAWLDGKITDPEAEMEWLERLLAGHDLPTEQQLPK
jgi:tRNA nucleotidyltransferase (CCA-adding enzyme)